MELDKIKSSITISLGTKNRLRKEKGSMSYEEYINYLLINWIVAWTDTQLRYLGFNAWRDDCTGDG